MPHSTHPKRLTRSARAPLLAAAALLSGVLVAGCGGSSGSPAVATAPGASTSGSTIAAGDHAGSSGSSAPSQAQFQNGLLEFAQCMRGNGVPNFPDPSAGGGFLFRTGAGIDPSSPVFEAAQAKCRKLVPGGLPPGPGTTTHPSAQALAHWVKVAQCMRKHDITGFPDPRTSVPSNPTGGAPGVISDRDGVILVFPSTIDTQSPLFTRAAAACGFQLTNH